MLKISLATHTISDQSTVWVQIWVRKGAKIIGIYAGHDDGGTNTFSAKKNEGVKTFFGEKNDGANALSDEKNDGAEDFFRQKSLSQLFCY